MTTSSPFTQGGNFLSAVQGSVDPRTGMFTFNFQLAHLYANNTLGPQLPLALNYSPLNSGNLFGLGTGVTPGLTSFDDRNGRQLLKLNTGEQYKTFYTAEGNLALRQHKLDTVRLAVLDKEKGEAAKKIQITSKSGTRETLAMVGGQGVYYPVRIETPLGHGIALGWDKAFRLSSILDERGGRALCTFEYPVTGVVNIRLWPDTAETVLISLRLRNDYLSKITQYCPDGDLVWQLEYDEDTTHHFNGGRPLNKILSPAGLTENVVYEGGRMRFRTQTGEGSLPAVVRHSLSPGAGQKTQTVTYDYSSGNYMGYGAQIQTFDPDSDNLYNVLSHYDYWSRETLVGSQVDQIPDRTTERHYNNYHLLVSEKETVAGTTHSTLRETAYYAEPGKQFIDQPPIFQMPAKQMITWSDGTSSRQEITLYEYDKHYGNLTKKTAPDGTVTTCEYFPATGAGSDCPPEPNGFTRFIKSRTVMPAAGRFKDVPVMKETWSYSAFPVCKNSSLSGAVLQTQVTHLADDKTLHTETYEYVNRPADYEHGRLRTKSDTVWGKEGARYKTTQHYTFDTATQGELTQTVQTIVDEHPGVKATKTLTLTHRRTQSILTGRLLRKTDVAGNCVGYAYDKLGRLVTKTNHSDKKPYTSVEHFSYTLPDKAHNLPAQTMHTDIRGNKTRTSHDGLGRIFRLEVLDPDGTLGWKTVGTHEFDVQGNNVRSVSLDILRDTGARNGELTQTLTRVRDVWGVVASETGKEDGVITHRLLDPIGKIWPDKKELGQLTTQETWLSSTASAQVTAKKRVYYDRAHRPVVSEIYAVSKDGKSWELTPYATTSQVWDTGHRLRISTDASGRSTAFQYDATGRTVATTYADGSVVKKAYAPFSLGALATDISLTDPQGKEFALGQQVFDGLGRLLSTTSGGRTTTMTYAAAWQQHPTTMTGPDGAVQSVKTDAALGEAPLDIQARGNAADVHQSFTYDLPTAALKSATEDHTNISLTTWPSGRLNGESTVIASDAGQKAQWQYSLGGLPQSYTDIGGIKESRTWQSTGLLESITDPTVKVMLSYDTLNRLTAWVASEKTGARMSTAVTFDTMGREATRTLIYQDKQGKTISTQCLAQQWTVTGQLSRRSLTMESALIRDESFTYDVRNRLKVYSCGGTKLPVDPYGNAFSRQEFTFDALGNIVTCLTTLASGDTDTANYYFENKADPCQLTRVSHSLINTKFHYPATIVLEYDKAGRMTRDESGRTLSYDALGRLNAVKGGATYGYDAHNRLVYQKVDKTEQAHRLYYRANRLIGEWMTKGDGKQPKPDDRQVRLVYAAGGCAAQEDTTAGQTTTILTGTDGKNSVIATAQEDHLKTTTYTPYGYTPVNGTHPLTGPSNEVTGTPKDVAGSTFFELEFPDSTATRVATIYSNGQNQVAVSVRTVVQDSSGNVVHLSPEQLWECLTLKTTRGDEIKKQPMDKGYAHLSVWNAAGDFAHAVRYGSALNLKKGAADDYSQIVVYLSTAELNGAYEIYAVLKFNDNFTETTEGGSGEGHFLSHLNINTIPTIDYSQSQNWRIDTSSGWKSMGTVNVRSQQKGFPVWTDGGTAESRYRKINIVNTNQEQGSPIKIISKTVSGTTIGGEVRDMGLKSAGSALFGWGYYNDHYDIIAWWVEPGLTGRHADELFGFGNGSVCCLQAFNHNYEIQLYQNVTQEYDKVRDDSVALYEWDIRYANTSIYQDGWSDTVYDAWVSVGDNFGNTGSFTVSFPTDAWDPIVKFKEKAHFILSAQESDRLRKQIAGLSAIEREAALTKAGAFHLAAGLSAGRTGDSATARGLKQKFSSQAVPSENDLWQLVDFCIQANTVLPDERFTSPPTALERVMPAGTLAVKPGKGFSIEGGKLIFNVAGYLND